MQVRRGPTILDFILQLTTQLEQGSMKNQGQSPGIAAPCQLASKQARKPASQRASVPACQRASLPARTAHPESQKTLANNHCSCCSSVFCPIAAGCLSQYIIITKMSRPDSSANRHKLVRPVVCLYSQSRYRRGQNHLALLLNSMPLLPTLLPETGRPKKQSLTTPYHHLTPRVCTKKPWLFRPFSSTYFDLVHDSAVRTIRSPAT